MDVGEAGRGRGMPLPYGAGVPIICTRRRTLCFTAFAIPLVCGYNLLAMAQRFRSWDVFLLFLLLTARARIDTLADLVFPGDWHRENLARLAGVGAWAEALGPERFFDWPTDLTLLLPISLAFGLLGLYWFTRTTAA